MGFFREYFLYIMLSVAAILTFVWLRLTKLRLSVIAGIALSLLHVAVGLLTVKAFAFLESGAGEYVGAMSLFGAIFFMPLFYLAVAKLFKLKTSEVFDVFTIPLVFTLMLARFNCLLSGCCLGLPIHGTALRYPTREAEILFYAVFLFMAGRKILKGTTYGEVYPLYMVLYGIFRGITECFRYSAGAESIFHVSHIWALFSFVIGAGIYEEVKQKYEKRTRQFRKGSKKHV